MEGHPHRLCRPIGITVSDTTASLPNLPAGQRVYVSAGNQNEIAVWSTAGTFISAITSTGACQLDRMRDAAADAAGNVYVANYEANDILEFSWNGTAWTCANTWGSKGSGNGQFMNPYGVAVGTDPFIDSGGPVEAIYVANSDNDRIQEFTPSGTYVAQVGSAGTDSQPGTFTQLRRVAVDADGDIWGADLWGYRLEEFAPSYVGGVEQYAYVQTIPNPIVPPGDSSTSVFNQVRELSFDSAGDLVAMDTVNQRVVLFNPSRSLLGVCGQRGFTSSGDFNWPRGVAVDPVTGDYWIADTKQSDLQILDPIGSSTPCAGVAEFVNEGSALGQLDYPYSITIAGGYAWGSRELEQQPDRILEHRHLHRRRRHLRRHQRLRRHGQRHRSVLEPDRGRRRPHHRQPPGGRQRQRPGGGAERQRRNRDRGGEHVHRAQQPLRGGGQRDLRRRRRGRRPRGGGRAQPGRWQRGWHHHRRRRDRRRPDYPLRPAGRDLRAERQPLHRRHLQRPHPGVLAGSGGPPPTPTPTATPTPTGTATPTPTPTSTPTPTPTPITGPLSAPVYTSTLVSPGQADMYPVDVTSNSSAGQRLHHLRLRLLLLRPRRRQLPAAGGQPGQPRHRLADRRPAGQRPAGGSAPGSLPVQLSDARAVGYNSATGDVYVADSANNRVLVFSFSPTAGFSYLTQFGGKGAGNGQFNLAYGVAVDPVNRWVYVTDGTPGQIEKFSIGTGAVPTYSYLTSFGSGTLNQPRQVEVAPNGDVLVTNRPQNKKHNYYYVYTSSGTLELGFGVTGSGNGDFTNDPRGVAISADGSTVFATNSGGDRTRGVHAHPERRPLHLGRMVLHHLQPRGHGRAAVRRPPRPHHDRGQPPDGRRRVGLRPPRVQLHPGHDHLHLHLQQCADRAAGAGRQRTPGRAGGDQW